MNFDIKKMRSEWKQLTDIKKVEVAGLDVGSFAVKLVQLRSGVGGYVAAAACKVDIGIKEQDDERTRSAKTVLAIRKCFEQSKMESRQVVCGICGPEVAVRPFSFPALPPEEITQAIMLEAEQVCPFDVRKNILEYQLQGTGYRVQGTEEENVQGVIVAATNEVVRGKVGIVSNASLNCALMDVDGLALVNCFEKTKDNDAHACPDAPPAAGRREKACHPSGRTTALLNVGHTFTNLVVVNDRKPPFIRDIPRGGSEINNLTTEATENTEKINATNLIAEINESLRYYMREQRIQAIDDVLVCGGFSLVKGFVELLNRQLPFGAELWNPFEYIGRQAETAGLDILDASGPEFAVAAGLAMRTL